MIHEQISVQMGHLVLHHTAGKLIESLGNLLEITIVIFNGHALWPCDIAVDSGDAETPFGIFTFLLALLVSHSFQLSLLCRSLELFLHYRLHSQQFFS